MRGDLTAFYAWGDDSLDGFFALLVFGGFIIAISFLLTIVFLIGKKWTAACISSVIAAVAGIAVFYPVGILLGIMAVMILIVKADQKQQDTEQAESENDEIEQFF